MSSAREYPYCAEIEVIFRDIDALGHVNNAVYFTYMETARTKFVRALLQPTSSLGLPIIVAEASCTYKSPAYLGEILQVGVGIDRFGTKSFHLSYRIEAPGSEAVTGTRLVALGRTVQVMYDYDKGQTIPVPESLKEQVHQFQGAWRPPES